jgi:hypothetical protein
MRIAAYITLLLLSFDAAAQHHHAFSGTIPSGARLFTVGDHTILIHALENPGDQKWTSFDSTLKVIATKKLVSPDAENIVGQTYLEAGNSLIRIDQIRNGKQLELSAFVFDATGNIISREAIVADSIYGLPFYISQSPGKDFLLLSQAFTMGTDSMIVRNIVIDKELNVVNNSSTEIPFNPELFDFYMPMLNDQKTIFIVTAEKSNSYRLGTIVNCYYLEPSNSSLHKLQFEYKRKKLKNISFSGRGDQFVFSALYVDATNKNDVAGIVSGAYNLGTQKYLKGNDLPFSEETKAQIKKLYGNEGRKGNLLNYMSLLGDELSGDAPVVYAYLTDAYKNAVNTVESKVPDAPEGLGAIKQNTAFVNSLVGTRPRGYVRGMSVAEANAYAAMYPEKNPFPNTDKAYKVKFKEPFKQKESSGNKNLLFLPFDNTLAGSKFLKIKTDPTPEYAFFTYFQDSRAYGAIYYTPSSSGFPYLNSIKITREGKVVETRLFTEKNKLLLPDYSFVTTEKELIAIYLDKLTSNMGLLKLKLQ